MEKETKQSRMFKPRNILVVLLVLFCLYQIVNVIIWSNKRGKTLSVAPIANVWTEKRKKEITDTCILYSPMGSEYPEIMQANCSCVADEIVKKYSPKQYEDLGKLTSDQIVIELKDIILHCGKISGRDTINTH